MNKQLKEKFIEAILDNLDDEKAERILKSFVDKLDDDSPLRNAEGGSGARIPPGGSLSTLSAPSEEKSERDNIIEQISNMYLPEENQLEAQKIIIAKLKEDAQQTPCNHKWRVGAGIGGLKDKEIISNGLNIWCEDCDEKLRAMYDPSEDIKFAPQTKTAPNSSQHKTSEVANKNLGSNPSISEAKTGDNDQTNSAPYQECSKCKINYAVCNCSEDPTQDTDKRRADAESLRKKRYKGQTKNITISAEDLCSCEHNRQTHDKKGCNLVGCYCWSFKLEETYASFQDKGVKKNE